LKLTHPASLSLLRYDRFKSGKRKGLPAFRLVSEGVGRELDVSAQRIEIVEGAMTMRRCADADDEVWSIDGCEDLLPPDDVLKQQQTKKRKGGGAPKAPKGRRKKGEAAAAGAAAEAVAMDDEA